VTMAPVWIEGPPPEEPMANREYRLTSMRERIEALGASFAIQSSACKGKTVTALL
jgi:signal transduction histidine kinase